METLLLELENKRQKLEDLKKLRALKYEKDTDNKDKSISTNSYAPLIQNLFENITSIDSITANQDMNIEKPSNVRSKKRISLSSKNFDNVNLNSLIIKPKELLVYNKEAQTSSYDSDINDESCDSNGKKYFQENNEDILNDGKIVNSTKLNDVDSKHIELSDEQKKHILNSNSMKKFIEDSIRIVERCIKEPFDVCIDYTAKNDHNEGHQFGHQIELATTFFDQKLCANRQVHSVSWSKQHHELLLAVYSKNNDQMNDNDGLAAIWNLRSVDYHPEYYLTCQSQLLSASFASFHTSLVVGGTYSGRVVIWDLRSPKRVPIQRSHLSPLAHTHPIYSCRIVGSQNSNNLVTVSTDGRLCSWSLEMMSQPIETIDLQCKQARGIAVTSLDFIAGNTNCFICGSEDGTVFSGIRHGSKPGIVEQFESHLSPITSVHCHPEDQQIDLTPYFLTSSIDWTVNLWSTKLNKPLLTFENSCDYINDVKWSPTHPSVFCSANSVGGLNMWDINADHETPVSVYNCESSIPINSIEWAHCGTKLAAGCDNGRINVFDIGEQLHQPRPDTSIKLNSKLRDIQKSTTLANNNEISLNTYNNSTI